MREGSWPGNLVIIEFQTLSQARNWYHSTAYRAILPLRTRHVESNTILVDASNRITTRRPWPRSSRRLVGLRTTPREGMQMYHEVSGSGERLVVLHVADMNIPSMGAIVPKLALPRSNPLLGYSPGPPIPCHGFHLRRLCRRGSCTRIRSYDWRPLRGGRGGATWSSRWPSRSA